TQGSLTNARGGVQFTLKNRLRDAEVVSFEELAINGRAVPRQAVRLELGDGRVIHPSEVDAAHPVAFPFRSTVRVQAAIPELPKGPYEIEMAFATRPFGKLHFKVHDEIGEAEPAAVHIPRDE